MKKHFRPICAVLAAAILSVYAISALADGTADAGRESSVQTNTEPQNVSLTEGITARSAAVIESGTGTILAELNGDEQRSISHMAKLMTVLIAAEKLETGELSMEDTVSVSAHANSMGGTQIWLDAGEKIKVEELVRSITIGNANDACVALAEKIAGSEEQFAAMMNSRGAELGMESTFFADCTGMSEKTVSTAHDLALLAAELSRHEELRGYFTTWIDNVRGGSVELVSTNRLIRTYNGITGLKSCSSDISGECLAASAERGDMSVCVILLGSKSDDDKFSEAKRLMDGAFQSYEIYTPEPDKKAYGSVKIAGGESSRAKVRLSGIDPVVIARGDHPSVTCEFSRSDGLKAPVSIGDKVGEICFKIGDEVIVEGEIVTSEEVKKIGMGFALKKVLLDLLNMKT